MVCEGGVSDAGDEAGDVEEVVNFCEVGVGECVSREAPEDGSGGEGAGGEDGFGDFAAGAVVPKEDDTFLGKEGVDEDDNGMCVGARCGEVRVKGEGLR